ncbi:MAG: beta-hydroxyacyl-ACP dehydratase [Planctomycetota bacterium]|nr:MAG: beta-hydroxyacyl-ACP dehydratase [Planctomycetota bacterium]
MRWIWIDGFVTFESGVRASAVKNLTLAEEYFHDHFPGYPVMPASLMVEGMAQTAGILVGEARDFSENVILAKIRLARFDAEARPGDRLRYDAELETIDERAAVTRGTVYRNDARIGQVDLMFSHVRPGQGVAGLPDHNFVFTRSFLDLLDSVRRRGGVDQGDEHGGG